MEGQKLEETAGKKAKSQPNLKIIFSGHCEEETRKICETLKVKEEGEANIPHFKHRGKLHFIEQNESFKTDEAQMKEDLIKQEKVECKESFTWNLIKQNTSKEGIEFIINNNKITRINHDQTNLMGKFTKRENEIIKEKESKVALGQAKNEIFKISDSEVKLEDKSFIETNHFQNIDTKFKQDKPFEQNCKEELTIVDIYPAFNDDMEPQQENVEDDTAQIYNCAHCDFSSRIRRNLIEHLACHDPPQFHCAHCSYISRRKTTLRKHLQLIHNFETDVNFRAHQNSGQFGNFKCHFCNKCYKLRYSLSRHLKIKHERIAKDFKCSYCSFSSHGKEILKTHINTHERKRVKCSKCTKSYSRIDLLNKHNMLEHEESRSLKCRRCDRTYKTENGLSRHLQKFGKDHYAEEFQGFKCEICEKVYTNNGSYRAHVTTHLGDSEKQFRCFHCGRSFALRHLLHEHIFPRGAEYVYKCDACEFSTIIACVLRKHKADHKRNEELIICDHCGFHCEGRDKRDLMIGHMRNDHGFQ